MMNRYRLLLVLVLLPILSGGAYAFDKTPLNPDFVKWRDAQNTASTTERSSAGSGENVSRPPSGYIPSPVNRSHMLNKSIVPEADANLRSAFPSVSETTYDLRTLNQVTSVKDQGEYGTCWAFSSLAAAESSNLKQAGAVENYSEKHLAYYAYTNIDDSYVSFADGNYSGSIYNQGGTYDISTALLSRWTGLVAESVVPYSDFETAPPATPANTRWVTNTHYAPGGDGVVNNIKYLLKTYGAVSILTSTDGSNYFDTTNGAYFNGVNANYSHGVTIVGWDDNYPLTNFKAGAQPTSNGAWIVRNSWGSSWGTDPNYGGDMAGNWGGNGYYYISYEDKAIVANGGWAFETGPVKSGYHMYLHDPLGEVESIGFADSDDWMANLFTATENHSLIQVALITPTVDTVVEVSIVRNAAVSGGSMTGDVVKNSSGGSVLLSTTLVAAGYHTLNLPFPIPVNSGETFAIKVNVKASPGTYPLSLENYLADYSPKATASPNQSYYSDGGVAWVDVTTQAGYEKANFCVRAIAVPSASMAPINMLLLN